MVALTSILSLAVAFVGSVQADRLFYNGGDLNGWDYVRKEHKGTVDAVTNVAYKGGNSIKMTQTFDPNYHDRYHSEVDHNDGYRNGDERFYGFSFRLSDSWDFSGSQSYNLAQFISYRPGSDNCGDDWMPSTLFWITGNNLHTRLVNGQYRGNDCRRNFVGFDNIAKIEGGKWNKVIIQAKWSSGTDGFFKLWLNGNKIVERLNVATTVSGNDQFQFRVGLYANGWRDEGNKLEGNQGFRQVWYDEVAVGTTYKDVDPDQN